MRCMRTARDVCQSHGQPSMRIDGVQFAGLDQRCDDGPVLDSGIVAGEEGVLLV